MPTDDRDELEDSLRTIHIEELKRKARELSNGEMIMHESEDIPADIAEQFWEQVVAFEEGPFTTHSKQLAQDGVELPPPNELDDQQLSKKLWELLDRLAARHVFVTSTNHLSDRDLYAQLWNESLREEVPDMQFGDGGAWHIDLLGSGCEEDNYLYLKHYSVYEWHL